MVERLLCYRAFTDIEFNPQKSINCQAHAVALCVALHQRGLLDEAMTSKNAFLRVTCGIKKEAQYAADGQQLALL